MRSAVLIMLGATFLVAGCATKEELIAKSAAVPNGIDLSGQWELRRASRDTVTRISEAGRKAAGGMERIEVGSKQKSGGSRKRSSDGALVHVFLETGNALKITQTEHGLFISFDRAIVEEYRFGEKRQVSVGPVIADRVSGWEGEAYSIETLDPDGAKLVESYRLINAGKSLVRGILVVKGDQQVLNVEQVFDRI